MLTPGRTIDNRIAVQNHSTTNEAYFCVAFAVDQSIANQLTFTSASGYKWLDDYSSFTMNGTQYSLSVAVCTSALGRGQTSDDVISAVTLSADVTTEQLTSVGSQFMQMKLMAVDVETFADISPNPDQTLAETVLTKALGLDPQTFNPFQ